MLGRAVVFSTTGATRDVLFALLNVGAVYALYFPFGHLSQLAVYLMYVGLAAFQFWLLSRRGSTALAFATPLVFLVAIKAALAILDPDAALPGNRPILPLLGALVGISYFAFRTCQLALEVRNGQVARPTLWQYLAFSFFAPTMAVGPISRYSVFHSSIEARGGGSVGPPTRAAMRLLVGAVKYRFLAGLLDQLTYRGLLLDGHPHGSLDLVIAAVAYYLFLYCNFSGFCDMAIGTAGLMGVRIEENFRYPFAARNARDFWNRWHITLSVFMRDIVFTPASKYLTRAFGIKGANHAAALSIGLVFILIGLWHGTGWNYLAFGVTQAVGVATTHYYTLWLKGLGRERFRAYMDSRWIEAAAIGVTLVFTTGAFFLFANSVADIREIFAALGWS